MQAKDGQEKKKSAFLHQEGAPGSVTVNVVPDKVIVGVPAAQVGEAIWVVGERRKLNVVPLNDPAVKLRLRAIFVPDTLLNVCPPEAIGIPLSIAVVPLPNALKTTVYVPGSSKGSG